MRDPGDQHGRLGHIRRQHNFPAATELCREMVVHPAGNQALAGRAAPAGAGATLMSPVTCSSFTSVFFRVQRLPGPGF
jgi:hypothetical protein